MIHIHRTDARLPSRPVLSGRRKAATKEGGQKDLFCTTPRRESPHSGEAVPRGERRPPRGTRGAARGGNTSKKQSASRRTVPQCQGLELRVSWFTTSYFCPCVAHLISSSEGVTKHPPPSAPLPPRPLPTGKPHLSHLSLVRKEMTCCLSSKL